MDSLHITHNAILMRRVAREGIRLSMIYSLFRLTQCITFSSFSYFCSLLSTSPLSHPCVILHPPSTNTRKQQFKESTAKNTSTSATTVTVSSSSGGRNDECSYYTPPTSHKTWLDLSRLAWNPFCSPLPSVKQWYFLCLIFVGKYQPSEYYNPPLHHHFYLPFPSLKAIF